MSTTIEDYKQSLFEAAAEYGKAGRYAYHELEEHIDESLRAAAAKGASRHQAEKDIRHELGEPETAIRNVLKADGKATYPLSRIFFSGALIAIGLMILVGVSALLMPMGSHVGGMRMISGDPDVLPYTVTRCGEYRALVPSAPDCRTAAMLHHYYEITDGRIVMFVFGLVCLAVFVRLYRKGRVSVLPKKTLLLLAFITYLSLGGITMLIGAGNWLSPNPWGALGDILTGIPLLLASLAILGYYFKTSR